ncbi:hypothetical protein Pla108_03680 [Botrimarina colliarenosi]|uniref:Uncharacterized protein n=1 Tax=Botrimarina colliarenosi TaxID=2528001 RepID=A0A5C6AII0_9BACT|nr:hypothetical protein Pla108_03680 [Botrimarina colliarenosi]
MVVDGFQSAVALIALLSRAFVFTTSEPIICARASDHCSFRVAYGPGLTHRQLRTLLSSMPSVILGADMESGDAR